MSGFAEHILAMASAKAAEMDEQSSTMPREGIGQNGSYNPADGSVDIIQGDTYNQFLDQGDTPLPHKSVPIAVPHVGDQYGPLGDERYIIVPVQGGMLAIPHHGPDDSPGAPAGERWIGHRNPVLVAGNLAAAAAGGPIDADVYDVWFKLTNDGVLGDTLGGASLVGGSRQTFQTQLGISLVLDDATQTVTITTPTGLVIIVNGETGKINIGSLALDPNYFAAMTAGMVEAALEDFKAAMVAANVTNAGAVEVPDVVGSTTVLIAP
jgi:hypothetical protein